MLAAIPVVLDVIEWFSKVVDIGPLPATLPNIPKISLPWAIAVALLGFVVVFIEGSYRLQRDRETEVEKEKRDAERDHAIQIRGLTEKIETLKQELQTEKEKQKRPRLSVIYTEPTTNHRMMNYSGLSIKNDGYRAFTVEVTAERRADLGLYFDDQPISEIGAACEYPLRVRAVRWETDTRPVPMGGLARDQASILFNKLAAAGEECKIVLTLKYKDYEQMEYTTQCCLQRDDSGRIYSRLL